MSNITALAKRLGYEFRDISLLETALTHRSVYGRNNERLEFLGDAALNFIIGSELFKRHPNAREGELSRMRAALVNGEMLASFAKTLALSDCLRLGAGEIKTGGRQRESILADALEAVIGAIYCDGGMEPCQQCVLTWYGERFADLTEIKPSKDAKSALQEWSQAHKLPLPTYTSTATGQAHAQVFYVTCFVEGLPHTTTGESTNRRKAEQIAAQKFLELLNE